MERGWANSSSPRLTPALKAFGPALLFVVLAPLLAIGLTGKAFAAFPHNWTYLLLCQSIVIFAVGLRQSHYLAVALSFLFAALFVLFIAKMAIDAPTILSFLLSFASGYTLSRHRTLAIIAISLLVIFAFWHSVLLALLVVPIGLLAATADSLLAKWSDLLRRTAWGIIPEMRPLVSFLIVFLLAVLVFASTYRALDLSLKAAAFQFDWVPPDTVPNFSCYLSLSLMVMTANNPVDVHPQTNSASLLISIQSFCGIFLFAIVLERMVVAALKGAPNRKD